MFLRKLRCLTAGIVALGGILAAPSRSQADITIQIQEVDGSGNPVGAPQIFGPTSLGSLNTSSTTTTSFSISNVGTSLGTGSNAASITTNLNLGFTSNFASNSTDGLEIIVTASNLTNTAPGAPATFTNQAGASNGIIDNNGSVSVSSTTSINSSTGNGTTSPSLATAGSSGNVEGPTTNSNVASLPSSYSIVQTIFVYVQPTGSINTASTFGGTISTDVNTNAVPVPAPGGLALALIGLPLVGLRRALRRKANETVN
jgi:hypothetical protein